MAGVMIGTDLYPNVFYLACDNHPTKNLQNAPIDTEVSVGQKIIVRKPGNPPVFAKAMAVRMVTPMYCRVAFTDGTFSKDTPPEYLTNVDWVHHGAPRIGSTVKVLWHDGVEYTATFEGTAIEEWEVKYKDKKKETLSRDQFFVRKPIKFKRKKYRPEPWEIPVCFGLDSSSDSIY
ncbi:unnamed protein product [Echinostoma caproni]|uniref:SGF29 C-terminal domain-containing protein n=1 Tax=Echinostoma caproni TaxID=27848 RepID=A0A183AFS6_9TREM|nr:unnamed protein product [Echinostoma caproni]